MKRIAVALAVVFLLLTIAGSASAYTLSGEITGAEWFGGITYVYAMPLDTSFSVSIGLALLGNGTYYIFNVDAGTYLLFAFQDLDGNLTPSVNDRIGYYGGDIPLPVEVSSSMDTLDIEVAALPFTAISGQVSCPAGQTGLTYVIAATDPLFENVTNTTLLLSLDGNASYTLFLDPGQYYVAAYLDADLSFSRTSGDPQVFYGAPNLPQLVDVSGGSAENIDLPLLIPPEVTMTLSPQSAPIVIPASGGSFSFRIGAQNTGAQAAGIHVWCDVILPSGQTYGPVLGPVQINLPAGFSLERIRTQNVPASAPGGDYLYRAHFGVYPAINWNENSFPFTKTAGSGDGDNPGAMGAWTAGGESFDVEPPGLNPDVPQGYALYPAHPNPFNPTTTISYQLPADSFVSLRVYDMAGRLVTTLADGWRQAGSHEVTFDASGLPSGIYFAKLTAGDYSQVQKLILLK
jgi:hypothetical protein